MLGTVDEGQNGLEEDTEELFPKDKMEWRKTAWSDWLRIKWCRKSPESVWPRTKWSGGRLYGAIGQGQNGLKVQGRLSKTK